VSIRPSDCDVRFELLELQPRTDLWPRRHTAARTRRRDGHSRFFECIGV